MSEGLRGDLSGLPEQGLVVVGFSGGADSTALAHWLAGRVDPSRLVLAHVNHLLRGEESDRDEAAARAFAQRLGLRFAVSRQDVGALARRKSMGWEECGREVRYAFFLSLAAGEDDRILTAHTANDNAETVLLNLCRGAGLSGLCGIPRERGKILRPLLGVSRKEVEGYCAAHGLSYVTDSSNLDREPARNRVRLDVLPALEQLNPQAVRAIGRAAEILRLDRDFLREEAEKLLAAAQREYGMDALLLREAHPVPRREALRLWLKRQGFRDVEQRHVAELEACLDGGGTAVFPGGRRVRCRAGLVYPIPERPPGPFSAAVRLPEKGEPGPKKASLPGGKVLILEKKPVFPGKSSQKIHNLDFKNALDYDIIAAIAEDRGITARTRREGDRFSPAGRGLSKPLKQVFQELGLPGDLRDGAVLLECGGRLAFCEGAGASEEFRVTDRTEEALFVTVCRENEEIMDKG